MSNFSIKVIHKPTIEISKRDESFLKEFLKSFCQIIIDIQDFDGFDKILNEWIKNIDKNNETILELMENHNKVTHGFQVSLVFFINTVFVVILIKIRR